MENHYAPDRNSVDGVAVVVRQKAYLLTNNIRTKSVEQHMYPDIDQLMLADERTVYQCASRNDRNCLWTAESGESVRAHLRSHSDRKKARELQTELARAQKVANEAQAELERRTKNRSEASKRGAETRKQNAQSNGRTDEKVDVKKLSVATVRKLDERVDSISEAIDTLVTVAQNIGLELSSVRHDLAKLKVADQDTIDKAAAYDAIRSQLKLS